MTGWRTVAVHGQPKPEDYPIVWRLSPADRSPGISTMGPSSGAWMDRTQWAPITLPEGDEPPPLPKPFKPMDTAPNSVLDRAYVLNDDGSVSSVRNLSASHSPPHWLGWCLPSEWPYAPNGGAS